MIRASYVDAIPEPWSRESPWTQYTLQDLAVNGKSRFYKPDIWHNVNLGVGKDFVSAAMCLLVRDLEGPNINEKFDILSKKYLQWCRVFPQNKVRHEIGQKNGGGGRHAGRTAWYVEQGCPHGYTFGISAVLL